MSFLIFPFGKYTNSRIGDLWDITNLFSLSFPHPTADRVSFFTKEEKNKTFFKKHLHFPKECGMICYCMNECGGAPSQASSSGVYIHKQKIKNRENVDQWQTSNLQKSVSELLRLRPFRTRSSAASCTPHWRSTMLLSLRVTRKQQRQLIFSPPRKLTSLLLTASSTRMPLLTRRASWPRSSTQWANPQNQKKSASPRHGLALFFFGLAIKP